MSVELMKAAMVRAPFDDTTANDFGVYKFTAGDSADTTNHQTDALPAVLRGKWVEIYVTGGAVGTDAMHFAFSENSSAEVDRSVAASEAGAVAKVGAVIPTGTTLSVLVPERGNPALGETPAVYFSRESTAAGMVAYVRRAS